MEDLQKHNMPGNPDQMGYPGEEAEYEAFVQRRENLCRGVMNMKNMRNIQCHLEGKRSCVALRFNHTPF